VLRPRAMGREGMKISITMLGRQGGRYEGRWTVKAGERQREFIPHGRNCRNMRMWYLQGKK